MNKKVLVLWKGNSRADILTAVDEAEASLASGEGHIITEESMRELAGKVKQRGGERLTVRARTGPADKSQANQS